MSQKPWRPNDWKNPHATYHMMGEVTLSSEGSAFEAGADAILEVLKAKGILLEFGVIFDVKDLWLDKLDHPHLALEGTSSKRSWLVCIPEEE